MYFEVKKGQIFQINNWLLGLIINNISWKIVEVFHLWNWLKLVEAANQKRREFYNTEKGQEIKQMRVHNKLR